MRRCRYQEWRLWPFQIHPQRDELALHEVDKIQSSAWPWAAFQPNSCWLAQKRQSSCNQIRPHWPKRSQRLQVIDVVSDWKWLKCWSGHSFLHWIPPTTFFRCLNWSHLAMECRLVVTDHFGCEIVRCASNVWVQCLTIYTKTSPRSWKCPDQIANTRWCHSTRS